MTNQYKAVILAAGFGTRMKSKKPKIIHDLAGKTVLEHVLDSFEAAGFLPENIVVVLGHGKDEVVKTIGDRCAYVVQDELLGTADALLRAKDFCLAGGFSGKVVVGCGDAPLIRSCTIAELVKANEEDGAECTVFTGKLADPHGYGRIIRGMDPSRVMAIVEQKDADAEQVQINEVNSGMFSFDCPELFDLLEKVENNNSQKEYYLTDIVRAIIKKGGKVSAYCARNPEEIFGINTRAHLAQAWAVVNRRNIHRHMENGVTVVAPENTHINCGVEIGADTVIHPYSVIEKDVVIGQGCQIGPFAHIETKTVIKDSVTVGNFVEVKRSVLGQGSKAKHLTYLGDTTLGQNVNVGAGTIVANYDGKHKHPTTVGDRAFIGSGTVIIAPNQIGAEAVTAAGAVVTKDTNVPDRAIVAGVPAKFLKNRE